MHALTRRPGEPEQPDGQHEGAEHGRAQAVLGRRHLHRRFLLVHRRVKVAERAEGEEEARQETAKGEADVAQVEVVHRHEDVGEGGEEGEHHGEGEAGVDGDEHDERLDRHHVKGSANVGEQGAGKGRAGLFWCLHAGGLLVALVEDLFLGRLVHEEGAKGDGRGHDDGDPEGPAPVAIVVVDDVCAGQGTLNNY